MRIPIHQIDAFTSVPFQGNPAAVCFLPSPVPDAWMQSLAAEMNLSETAFLRQLPEDPMHDYELRWFTPASEVQLCGHATLASAHFLYETDRHPTISPIRFLTRYSGTLICNQASDHTIHMNFPADSPQSAHASDELLNNLNLKRSQVLNVFQNSWDIILELQDDLLVRDLAPNFTGLIPFSDRGIAVTAACSHPDQFSPNTQIDFVSRFFAPKLRVNEDPVTGSLHCVLTPYWSEKLNRNSLTAYQASPRGGILHLSLDNTRVNIAGRATTVFKGNLTQSPF